MAVVLVCFGFSNAVLDGKFINYGSSWVSPPNGTERGLVLLNVFPNLSRCVYHIRGTGGGVEDHNLKCLLAPNSVTRYVFLIMWFWYVSLVVINSLNVLLNVGMMGHSYRLRVLYLKRAMGSKKVHSYHSTL